MNIRCGGLLAPGAQQVDRSELDTDVGRCRWVDSGRSRTYPPSDAVIRSWCFLRDLFIPWDVRSLGPLKVGEPQSPGWGARGRG